MMNRRRFLKRMGIWVPVAFPAIVHANPFRSPAKVARMTSAGPSYLVEENCEGTGTPSGWSVSGTLNWDYTDTALQPFQSAYITNGGSGTYTISPIADVWMYFLFNPVTLPVSVNSLCAIRSSALSGLAVFRLYATGAVGLFTNGGDSSQSVGSMAAGNLYHVWIHFVSGGTSTLAFSSDGVKPTSGNNFVSRVSQSSNAERIVVAIAASATPHDAIVDRILVSASTIGDNP